MSGFQGVRIATHVGTMFFVSFVVNLFSVVNDNSQEIPMPVILEVEEIRQHRFQWLTCT